jgi:hypothetical protein
MGSLCEAVTKAGGMWEAIAKTAEEPSTKSKHPPSAVGVSKTVARSATPAVIERP